MRRGLVARARGPRVPERVVAADGELRQGPLTPGTDAGQTP